MTRLEPPILETPRLTLRRLQLTDAEDMFAYASDNEVSRYVTWESHRSIADSRAFLQSVTARYQNSPAAEWGIVAKATGRLIGTIAYHDWALHHRRAEIGYALGRAYWGQGLMTEAAQAVIAWGFRAHDLYRIQAMCLPANIGSARVMEKAGMQFEGLLRGYILHKGTPCDMKLYAIVRPDWERLTNPAEERRSP